MATICIQPKPCDCWVEKEQHCCASFNVYEACVQKRIEELERQSVEFAGQADKAEHQRNQEIERTRKARERIAELEALNANLENTLSGLRQESDDTHDENVALRTRIAGLEAEVEKRQVFHVDAEELVTLKAKVKELEAKNSDQKEIYDKAASYERERAEKAEAKVKVLEAKLHTTTQWNMYEADKRVKKLMDDNLMILAHNKALREELGEE